MTPEQQPNGGRLDSWKEIAVYLNQGVRTVQRWERDEALPIHRPTGKRRGTVYAFRHEIDTWFRQRGVSPVNQQEGSRQGTLPRFVWSAVAAATLAAVAILILIQNPDHEIAAASSMQVVDSIAPGWGAFSPDGQRIVYRSGTDESLFLRDFEAGTTERLVAGPVHRQVLWSPDSSQVVYARSQGREYYLEVLDLGSGKRRVLRTGGSFDDTRLPIGWDSVANRLLCSTPAMNSFEFLSLQDLSISKLRTPPGAIADPALSPDGRFLAYSRRNGRFHDLELLPTNGEGTPTAVASNKEDERYPVWSPDGRTLLFVRVYGISTKDKTELWSVSFEPEAEEVTGEPFLVESMPRLFREIRPVLTPSRDLLWIRRELGSKAHAMEVDPQTGEAVGARSDFSPGTSAKGWAPREAARLYFWDPTIRWQVLSDVLAFRERDMDTGDERIHQIPWPDLPYRGFSYSKDHTKGVFPVGERGSTDQTLYLYDVASNHVSKLVASDRPLYGVLSNDTRRVAFVEGVGEAGDQTLMNIEVATKAVETLYRGSQLSMPRWSPDDTEIAFADGKCLMVSRAASGKTEKILCAPEPPGGANARLNALMRRAYESAWSPGGEMLVWPVLNHLERRAELWVIDRHARSQRVVWGGEPDYGTRAARPAWSPDGRFISFTIEFEAQIEVLRLRHPLLSLENHRDTT